MKLAQDQVRSVVLTVWSTQLGLEIRNVEEAFGAGKVETLTAVIHVSGDFHGGIRVECGRGLIRRAASIMFSMPAEDLTLDDERDVIGELTNVIAGNVKALLPGTNSISLPTIVDGRDYRVTNVDVKTSDEAHFALDGEPMAVTVFEHSS